MPLLHLLSYLGIAAAGGFVVLSLASGLLWISELIEEHSRTAKSVGIRAIYAIILLHILLYFTDSLPLPHVLFSTAAHIVYLQNFSHTWPLVSLTSPAFIASCVLAILNHFAWFFYFSRVSREARARLQRVFRGSGVYGSGIKSDVKTVPGFADTATFFALCVWFVPLFLFLSLSANDNALPVVGNGLGSPTPNGIPQIIQPSRSSLFKSILDFLPFLRRRRDRSDGILVTHTPTNSAPSTPRTSYSGQTPYSAGSRTSFEIVAHPPSSAPSLRPPPRRASTGPMSLKRSVSRIDQTSEDGATVTVAGAQRSSSSLLVSRSVSSEEKPVRRRTAAE